MRNTNKLIFTLLLTALFMLPLLFMDNTYAYANGVTVYKDGAELTYTDVHPQIINDRTMVPLAETAVHFAMTYVWNAETSTMIFTGNGRTMIHTVYDNTIYVNGTPVQFDFTSVIVNDRTLMPIRMLAEAIGCYVEWDATGIVDIWTDAAGIASNVPEPSPPEPSNQSQPEPSDQQEPTNQPNPNETSPTNVTSVVSLYSATKDRPTIVVGEPLTITVATNKIAQRAKITDAYGDDLEEVDNYNEDSQGRYFTIIIYPEEIGEITFSVYAGDDEEYSTTPKEITVVVTEPVKNIIIERIKLEDKSVSSRDEVFGVLYTSRNVRKVIIEDSDGKTVKTINKYSSSINDTYMWEFYFYAETDSGDYTYNVVAYDDKNDSEMKSFEVTVKGSENSHYSSTEVEIVDIEYEDTAEYDEKYYITVTTNKLAVKIEVFDEEDNLMDSEKRYTASGSNRVWEMDFYPEYSGVFYIYAYGDDDDQAYKSIRIYVD